ncbi:hypothetical protein [Rhizobium sp. BK068]|uniref:hypothetical protein n=1 Tax=Rhizobium sp. BK068 TaxID=2512130 RepID=UPI0010491746|nr:hypothetical protein [Rhizobium sp. BK068]TCM62269.1 hypothetical protein EV291_15420 [Rhizobium sp. BK068]
MNYDHDYIPEIFTGIYLNDQLTASGTKEILLQIGSLALQTFNDAKSPQWVASFGAGIPKLRIKPAIGGPLRQAFGPDSKNWIGKRIALSVEPIEWEDQTTHEMKSGFAIKARPVADDEEASVQSLPNVTLDDDIPF